MPREKRVVATTAEKLQAITDTAEFEILAIRVLKELEPSCAALVHLGINAAGKTIRGALDGFVRVQGSSPAHYIMAECAGDAVVIEKYPKLPKSASRNCRERRSIQVSPGVFREAARVPAIMLPSSWLYQIPI
jgi:hypothetical protein